MTNKQKIGMIVLSLIVIVGFIFVGHWDYQAVVTNTL